MKRLTFIAILLAAAAAALLIPVGGGMVEENSSRKSVSTPDMSPFSEARPGPPLRLLFIHHSCGGHLLADAGPTKGIQCIFESHPEGGGLRRRLEAEGYEVHEASYGSEVGDRTDILDWLPKFRDKMEKVLNCDHQDTYYTDGRRNHVVAFKSCYPNNLFTADGPDLTPARARAAYAALLPEFARHPEVLFICVTAPPLAPRTETEPLWKRLARLILGKDTPGEKLARSGPLAREFNNWLKARDGWLASYEHRNVVVFDYYDILTDSGASDFSRYPTEDGFNSHPSREGNDKAAGAFVPFLNRAVKRAALVGVE